MDVKIYSVFHKPYWIPDDKVYVPIQVGFGSQIFNNNKPILRDDNGFNISNRNKNYCELTAIYWIWKNCHHDYIGVDHYRRHFAESRIGKKKTIILKSERLVRLLSLNKVILPKKRHYFIETNYSQYCHAHHEIDLIKTRYILEKDYPEYLISFDYVMAKRSGHRFNMFIMPWHIFDSYCTWLFDIIFKLDDILDISTYNNYDSRVFGFVAERLLDVYLINNKIKILDMDYVFMDKEHLIRKYINFVKRKIKLN